VAAGAALYRDTGVAFPEDSRTTCAEADAVFLGATGLPEVRLPDGTGVSIAWELRKSLALFAAVRPVRLFHADHCPLKGKAAGQVRLTIVRENTEGIYASRWAGTTLHDEVAVNPIVITRRATERIVRCAFDLARRGPGAPGDGRRRVTCVDKSNVLACWALFRKVFHEIGVEYPEIEKDAAYIDAMTVHFVRQPERFDVVVTENQHGDILSDLCAALVGGLGFAPSANLGAHRGMFEPSTGRPRHRRQGVGQPRSDDSHRRPHAQLAGRRARGRQACGCCRTDRRGDGPCPRGRPDADGGHRGDGHHLGDGRCHRRGPLRSRLMNWILSTLRGYESYRVTELPDTVGMT